MNKVNSQMTDHELVEQYIAGNENALAILLERHKEKVFTSIFFLVKNESLAEDIFQDTFVKVINRLRSGNYNNEGKFLPWVMRIAYNLCMDYYRKQKRMPGFTSTDEEFDIFNVLKYQGPNAEDKLNQAYASKLVQDLIKDLPEDQRQVLVLRHYVDMSFKEIADMTGVSVNTALGRMRYALIRMRKLISEKQIAL